MPELPEVEVTRQRIAPLLLGRRIAAVHTTRSSYFFLTPPARLRRALTGRSVEAIERRGKYLVLHLDDASQLVLHLGMTGQLFSSAVTSPRLHRAETRGVLRPEAQHAFRPDEHTHLRFRFKDEGPEVWLRDVRKFGKVLWLAPGARTKRLDRLGVDALELTPEALHAASRRRSKAVKTLLLDQSVVAGVGNIYADEALFEAGVRPGRAASRLTRGECVRIVTALRRVIARAIATGGSSIQDFVAPDGRDGRFQDEHYVYAREGLPCRRCGALVRRRLVGQRSTHFCPSCQR